MNLQYYLKEGYERRFQYLALKDFWFAHEGLYLNLIYIDPLTSYNSYEGFDIKMEDFILKLESTDNNFKFSMLHILRRYTAELEPFTLWFNRNESFEIMTNAEPGSEQGWWGDYGDFDGADRCVVFDQRVRKSTLWLFWEDIEPYATCHALLDQIHQIGIGVYEPVLSALKYERLKKMLKLCVFDGVQETINFIAAYYLKTPDFEQKRRKHGESYDTLVKLGNELIERLEAIKRKHAAW